MAAREKSTLFARDNRNRGQKTARKGFDRCRGDMRVLFEGQRKRKNGNSVLRKEIRQKAQKIPARVLYVYGFQVDNGKTRRSRRYAEIIFGNNKKIATQSAVKTLRFFKRCDKMFRNFNLFGEFYEVYF